MIGRSRGDEHSFWPAVVVVVGAWLQIIGWHRLLRAFDDNLAELGDTDA